MDDATTDSEQVKSRTFYQDFFGFSSEEWCHKISNKNSPVKQPICDHDKVRKHGVETNPMFRSKSVSFKYMRFKIGSSTGTRRSKSVPAIVSKSKSRWQVFMSGFGSGKFPTKIDMSDIKNRQLRSPITPKVSQYVDHVSREESGGRRISERKVWWRLVDILRCGGRYERDTKGVV